MGENFSRIEALIGLEKLEKLQKSKILLFGIGGVGGYVAEALVRSGIGKITIVDSDIICESNLNRQLIATHTVIGKDKVEVMKKRLLDINPDCNIEIRKCFYLPPIAEEFNFKDYDYIVDAIDTITAKLDIIQRCKDDEIPIISSMGTGNKLDATQLKVGDIYQTSMCPLAKVMRRELRKRKINKVKVIYSTEQVIEVQTETVGSMVMVPGCAGLIMAGEVIKDLLS